MSKPTYSPISQAASSAFVECVEKMVIQSLSLPSLTANVTPSGEQFTGAQQFGAEPDIVPPQR